MRKLAVHELDRPGIETYKGLKKHPVVVVLDNIRSANNVGSVFRTSDAFLVERVMLTGITPRPPHKDIQKTALGATESVEWTYFENVADCLRRLKSEGYTIIAVEQAKGAVSLEEMPWRSGQPYAIVFGNEVKGVSEEAMLLADQALEVPQWGTKHSLNISVCAGIVLWDVLKAIQ